jgi:hypothetical protein
VSPGKIVACVASPEAITQITSRRIDFPKPTEVYAFLDVFGRNLVSSEGMLWRQHRRVAAPSFNEKNNHLVWLESLHQAQNMVRSWTGADGKGNTIVTGAAEDIMRLSLHVISRAGFGVRLLWPGQEDVGGTAKGKLEGGVSSAGVPVGHTMSFEDALGTLLENVLWIVMLKWLLSMIPDNSIYPTSRSQADTITFFAEWSPIKSHQRMYESYVEWGRYMREICSKKKEEMRLGTHVEGMDLMGKPPTFGAKANVRALNCCNRSPRQRRRLRRE